MKTRALLPIVVIALSVAPTSVNADAHPIAFSEQTDETIQTIRPDGTGRAVLVENGYDPAWSPDGRRLAFVRRVGRTTELFVVRADGTHVRRVTRSRALESQPAWSPDGSQLAYVRGRGAYSADVWIVSLRTGALTRVTRTGYRNRSPSWSPDGRWIAFSSPRNGYGTEGTPDVYLKDLETDRLVKLTSYRGQDWAPAWSPDGGTVAFLSDRSGTSQVWITSVSDGTPVQVTDANAPVDSFAWSRDGTRLVLARHHHAGSCRLWIYGFASDSASAITGEGCAINPTWG